MTRRSVVVNMAAWRRRCGSRSAAWGYRDRRVRLGATLLAAAAHLLAPARVRTIYLGQINLILMAAIMWDLCQPDLRRRAGAAVEGRAHRRRGRDQARPADLRPLSAGHPLVPRGGGSVAGSPPPSPSGSPSCRMTPPSGGCTACSSPTATGPGSWAGGEPVAARVITGSPVRRGRPGPWIVAAWPRSRRPERRLPARPGRVPRAGAARHRADRPARVPGLLGPPLGLDRPRGRRDPAHYAIDASRRGARAGRPRALGSSPGWSSSSPPGRTRSREREPRQLRPLLPVGCRRTPTRSCSQRGDQPTYVEYHWHGFQLIWGNTYIFAGLALLLFPLFTAFRLRMWRKSRPRGSLPQSTASCLAVQ